MGERGAGSEVTTGHVCVCVCVWVYEYVCVHVCVCMRDGGGGGGLWCCQVMEVEWIDNGGKYRMQGESTSSLTSVHEAL